LHVVGTLPSGMELPREAFTSYDWGGREDEPFGADSEVPISYRPAEHDPMSKYTLEPVFAPGRHEHEEWRNTLEDFVSNMGPRLEKFVDMKRRNSGLIKKQTPWDVEPDSPPITKSKAWSLRVLPSGQGLPGRMTPTGAGSIIPPVRQAPPREGWVLLKDKPNIDVQGGAKCKWHVNPAAKDWMHDPKSGMYFHVPSETGWVEDTASFRKDKDGSVPIMPLDAPMTSAKTW